MKIENNHKLSETKPHAKLDPVSEVSARISRKIRAKVIEAATDGCGQTVREVMHDGNHGKLSDVTESESVEHAARLKRIVEETAGKIVAASITGGQSAVLEATSEIVKAATKEVAKSGVRGVASEVIDATDSELLIRNKAIVSEFMRTRLDNVETLHFRGGGSHKVHDEAVSFKGLHNVEKIADIQYGGTCWAEALENFVQLMLGDTRGEYNNLSTAFLAEVASHPDRWDAILNPNAELPTDRWNIDPSYYPKMLALCGVKAECCPFSHEDLQTALDQGRPAIVVGDLGYLGEPYPDAIKGESGHALMVIEWRPDTQQYVLLDSNFDKTYVVSKDALRRFATGDLRDRVANFVHGNMVIANDPARWPYRRMYVDGRWCAIKDGRIIENPLRQLEKFLAGKSLSVGLLRDCGIKDVGNAVDGKLSAETLAALRKTVSFAEGVEKKLKSNSVSFRGYCICGANCRGCVGTCDGSCVGTCWHNK